MGLRQPGYARYNHNTQRRRKRCRNVSMAVNDRFFPNRRDVDLEIAEYAVKTKFKSSPNDYRRRLSANVFKDRKFWSGNSRIFSHNRNPREVEKSPSLRYFEGSFTPHRRKTFRHIPDKPERTLDCPDFMDDYYLKLLDWSSTNIIAIALGNAVYLWDANDCKTEELMCVTEAEGPITSVAWCLDGIHLAVGLTNGDVQLWDTLSIKKSRTMRGHWGRVGSLAWNGYILSSGSMDLQIFNHDARKRHHITSVLNAHEEEVCGLEWCKSGKYLASGGNDNILCIWDIARTSRHGYIRRMREHSGAVKALAWSPHQRNLLASGGGMEDRSIKFWNIQTGVCLYTKDTLSQVCALQWNHHEPELLSSHGSPFNQLTLWEYPSMSRITELYGHTSRALHLAQSPDGFTVTSLSADESLQFWKVFGPPDSTNHSDSTSHDSANTTTGLYSLHNMWLR